MEKQTRRSHGKRALMLLMTMTLATTCVVGSTYAKYATHDGGGAEARIAKFGVEIMTNGQVFQKEYANGAGVTTVRSSDSVIAPGTSGEPLTIAITGKPEVSIKVTFTGNFAIANWEVEDENKSEKYYCPLTITVGETDFFGMDYENAEDFQKAVNGAIAGYSKEYNVKDFQSSEPIGKVIEAPSVSWRWDFEGKGINDTYDTYLANRACEKPGEINDKVATVGIAVETVIEQID